MPDGSKIQYNENGTRAAQWGPGGLRKTTFAYDSARPLVLATATDSYGAVWAYEPDEVSDMPGAVVSPGGMHRLEIDYVPADQNGEYRYQQIRLKDKVSGVWSLRSTADYTYNAFNRVTSVTLTDYADPQNPMVSAMTVDYELGVVGRNRVYPVNRIHNSATGLDIIYSYPNDETIDGYQYGVSQIRRRAEYGVSDDTQDQVTRYYFYQKTVADFTYNTWLFRAVAMTYQNGSLQPYSTVEHRRFGYLARFTTPDCETPSLSQPCDAAVLEGKDWQVVDAGGEVTTYEYSTDNARVTRVTLPTTDTIEYTYLQSPYQTDTAYVQTIKDTRGKYTKYLRDANIPAIVTGTQASDSGTSWTTTMTKSYYDSTPWQMEGLVEQVTIPAIEGSDGQVTTYDYAESIGGVTYYFPDATTVTYDGRNNGAYASATSRTYHTVSGLVSRTQDALGKSTYYFYDSRDRLIQTMLPEDASQSGTVGSFTATTVTDTSKSWTANELKGMTLQIYEVGFFTITGNTADTVTVSGTISGAGGKQYWAKPYTTVHYSACCGLVDMEKDERGYYTYYEYDDGVVGGPGRLTGVRNAITGSGSSKPLVKYSYDGLGRTTGVRTYKDSTDSTGRITEYEYDQLGRVTKVTYPGSGLLYDEYYQYDVSGNLVAKLQGTIDGNGDITSGEVTAYEYDELDRLSKVKYNYSSAVWPLASIAISNSDVSYQYDGGSSLKMQMEDSSGISAYSYDMQGRLATYAPPLPSGYSVAYSYNNAGDKTQVLVKLNNSDRFKTEYSYFKNGWLKLVTAYEYSGGWQEKARVSFAYDAAGRRTAVNNANGSGVQTALSYNSRSETRSVSHATGRVLYSLQYSRDAGGNPLQISYSGTQVPSPYANSSAVYGYDQLSRLTSETYPGVANAWTYDWVGNRLQDGSYNAVDQLDAGSGYTYDLKGALAFKPSPTADPRLHYQYGSDDLMRWISREGDNLQEDQTSMLWDADEQRLQVQEEGAYANWQFLYDTAAGIPAVLVQRHEHKNGVISTYFVREPGGELLASVEPNQSVRYYHFDALGSTVLTSDSSGTPIGAYAYSAWGESLASPASWQPYQYVGQLGYYTHHAGQGAEISNWLQLGVRFYHPELGRFERRDPIISIAWAAFEYADDSPASVTDPTGNRGRKTDKPKPCTKIRDQWKSGSPLSGRNLKHNQCQELLNDLSRYIEDCVPPNSCPAKNDYVKQMANLFKKKCLDTGNASDADQHRYQGIAYEWGLPGAYSSINSPGDLLFIPGIGAATRWAWGAIGGAQGAASMAIECAEQCAKRAAGF